MSEKEARHYGRRRIVVDKHLQYEFTFRIVGLLCFCSVLFLLLAAFGPVLLSELLGEPYTDIPALLSQSDFFIRVVLLPLVMTGLCALFFGLRETARIAGPNFRFRSVFGDLQAHRIPRGVKIRNGDYLHAVAIDFDKALKTMSNTVLALKENHSQSHYHLEKLCESSNLDGREMALLQETFAASKEVAEILDRLNLVGSAPEYLPLDLELMREREQAERIREERLSQAASSDQNVGPPVVLPQVRDAREERSRTSHSTQTPSTG